METIDVVTNRRAGALLGLSESGVSRLMSGHRNPSWGTMAKIALVLNWPSGKQTEEVQAGTFADSLRGRLNSRLREDLRAALDAEIDAAPAR